MLCKISIPKCKRRIYFVLNHFRFGSMYLYKFISNYYCWTFLFKCKWEIWDQMVNRTILYKNTIFRKTGISFMRYEIQTFHYSSQIFNNSKLFPSKIKHGDYQNECLFSSFIIRQTFYHKMCQFRNSINLK